MIKELKKTKDDLTQQIAKLSKQKANIEKQILSQTTNLEEKISVWENANNSKKIGDLFQCQKYPFLYKKIKSHDYDRHRTIDLKDYFLEEVLIRVEEREETEEDIKLLNEIIDNNLGSVVIDW